MTLSASALAEEAAQLSAIPREVWETTKFDAKQKILDVLVQRRIGMEQSVRQRRARTRAMSRVSTSYFLPAGVVRQQLGGRGLPPASW